MDSEYFFMIPKSSVASELLKYSRTTLIRIGLALRVNVSRILQNELAVKLAAI